MAYIMQVSGRLFEYSETVKIFKPHLFRSSNSWKEKSQKMRLKYIFTCQHTKEQVLVSLLPTFDSKSSLSVLTPNRAMPQLRLGPWDTFFTPLIWVISCCFFFFSRAFGVGEGISTSFCLSVRNSKNPMIRWLLTLHKNRLRQFTNLSTHIIHKCVKCWQITFQITQSLHCSFYTDETHLCPHKSPLFGNRWPCIVFPWVT